MQPEDLDVLFVFLHKGPDGQVGLFSRNNRRLIALQMLQSVRRDLVVRAKSMVLRSDDKRDSPVDGKSYGETE